MIKNVLIKTSGDTSDLAAFREFAIEKAKSNYVVVICGGGSQINQALKNAGFEIKFNDHGRVTETWEERKIARDILEKEQKDLQDSFVGKGISVLAPLLEASSVLCPINGDNMVKAFYLGFDEIYVFTLKDRIDAKKEVFKKYEKVQIVGI
ncbi:MAG: hypothetical protein WC788_00195 [Candidatus Paceibacterota bacterium]